MAIVQQARRVRGVDHSIASLGPPPTDGTLREDRVGEDQLRKDQVGEDPASVAPGSIDTSSIDPETGFMALDQSELTALVQRYQAPTWRYLRLLGADPHEADDLMQEAFVVCAERLRAGEQLLAPGAFVRGVARNLLLADRRRDRRRPPTVQWLEAVEQFVTEQPEAIEDGRVDALRLCVKRLQGRVRQAVQWHHLDGLSREEVARRLGIGLNGIKSLLGRARESLRECVKRAESKEQS